MLPYNDMLIMLPSADLKILKDYFAKKKNLIITKHKTIKHHQQLSKNCVFLS